MSYSPNSGNDAFEPLVIRGLQVSYSRQMVDQRTGSVEIRSRWFVNDPWELIAHAISKALPAGRDRDAAQSFRLQAEDYFHASTTGRELAVKPVLLYYAFLNLAKAYGVSANQPAMAGRVYHGIQCHLNTISVMDTEISFNVGNNQTSAYPELIRLLGGDTTVLSASMRLGDVAPQILTGHRLWCNAASASERFLSIDWLRLYHSLSNKNTWIMLDLTRGNFSQLNLSVHDMLSYAELVDCEEVPTLADYPYIRVRQRTAAPYISDPEESLRTMIPHMQNNIWETVRFGSPYRKYYIYCSPPTERRARLPQIASIYLLMFVLSYVTRYDPGTFAELLDSDYGPFIATFISESPMQFLYLLSSEIMGREVSKPAII